MVSHKTTLVLVIWSGSSLADRIPCGAKCSTLILKRSTLVLECSTLILKCATLILKMFNTCASHNQHLSSKCSKRNVQHLSLKIATLIRHSPTESLANQFKNNCFRNVERFRGGLAFKAHRLLHHSTPGLRVIKKKKMKKSPAERTK